MNYKDQIEVAKMASLAKLAAQKADLRAAAKAVLEQQLSKAVDEAVRHGDNEAFVKCVESDVAEAAVELLTADGVACLRFHDGVVIYLDGKAPVTRGQ